MSRNIPFSRSPVILAPIAGPGTPELTAAAANAGIFSFLPGAYSDPERIRYDVDRVRSLTREPFGVNLFIETPLPHISDEELARADARLNVYRDELGIAHPATPARPPQRFTEQLAVVLELRPRAFSFVFGIPSAGEVSALKDAGIYTIGTATSVEEALALQDAGIDAICAQGAEAGGHRASFLSLDPLPLVGTMALVPLIVDAVSVPVIAAGGITDGRGVAAALCLGAAAAQLGTAFLRTPEAQTSSAYRNALATSSSSDTTITRAYSGRPARGIANRMAHELDAERTYAPYPYQNALTRDIRNAAAASDSADYLSLWAGQAFPLARAESVTAIVERLSRETTFALESARRNGWSR